MAFRDGVGRSDRSAVKLGSVDTRTSSVSRHPRRQSQVAAQSTARLPRFATSTAGSPLRRATAPPRPRAMESAIASAICVASDGIRSGSSLPRARDRPRACRELAAGRMGRARGARSKRDYVFANLETHPSSAFKPRLPLSSELCLGELGRDAGDDDAAAEARADRLTPTRQQVSRRCRSHRPSRRGPALGSLFPVHVVRPVMW